MDNFTPIRNGLLAHALVGKLSPFDFGLYVFLIMRADYSSGIYNGCAMTIACQFGDPSLKEHVQKALRRLRDKKYVNYRNGDGSRGAYKILINKFFVTVGELSGQRLNAWKHNGLVQPEYEPWNSGDTVTPLSWHGGDTVVAPNKDLKTIDAKTKPSSELENRSDQGGTSKKKTALSPSQEALRLSALLKTEIRRHKADYPVTQQQERKWAQTVDRMLRLDKRTSEQVEDLIRRVQHDEFWFKNVLSMDTLREKFDELSLRVDTKPKNTDYQPPSELPSTYISASERRRQEINAQAGGTQ